MTTHAPVHPLENLRLALIPSVALVLFLFYIDEGWYSFRWMLNWGNWAVFVLYMILITPFFWLIAQSLFRKRYGLEKVLLISVVGIPLLLLLLLSLFGYIGQIL
jgi:hypothetical protein